MIESITSAIIVLAISLLIWGLLDLAYSLYKNPDTKTRWAYVIIFVPIGGPLYYFRVVKKAQLEGKEFNSSFDKAQI